MSRKYFGSAEGYGGDINAKIEISDEGKLISVELSGPAETQGIGDRALNQLSGAFVGAQAWDVDIISGATITSTGAKNAVREAMVNAGLVQAANSVEHIEADIVIVGCGITGIAAGLAAAERGVEVVMLERTQVFGGNGVHAHGGYFVESYLQKEAGETFSLKEAFEQAMFFNNYLCDPLIMRKHLGEGAETVRWLNKDHDAGLTLPHVYKSSAQEGEPFTYIAWDAERTLWPKFRAELESRDNVQLIFGAKGTELIMDENDSVAGVIAIKDDGSILRISCKAAYMATGGYLMNDAMLKDAIGEELVEYLVKDTSAVCDGSGLKMAWAAGAGRRNDNMITNHGGRSGLGGKVGLLGIDLLLYIPILWVNRFGERFMDEEIVPNALFFSNLLMTQKGRAFVVFDQASLDEWKVKKIPLKMAFWDRFSDDYYCPPVTTFEEDFAEAQEVGRGFKADTIEELAEISGMDPQILAKTISDYNGYVERKCDDEFCKSAESLVYKVEQGPFYAVQCRVQAQGTVGGIKINDSMQAVTQQGKVIPGLYAGGADAGGLYNGSYSIQGGTAVSWALTSGRLAGIAMAEYVSE